MGRWLQVADKASGSTERPCCRHHLQFWRFRPPTNPRNLPRSYPKRKCYFCSAFFLILSFFQNSYSFFPRSTFFLLAVSCYSRSFIHIVTFFLPVFLRNFHVLPPFMEF